MSDIYINRTSVSSATDSETVNSVNSLVSDLLSSMTYIS
jgi:hypothetical protein